ncbi:MAG: hypothetical protein A2X93_04280 [Deltaproteobacteria bacterium GWC2_56_8]|nr:MAG: hypothetical protein A2X99_00655 [Deltaproteobacteria bacterium GWB2_55_19]OGP38511.1 MAG: hypothetical protein A2X93_04280 [Deltaproteobacteria bacterium GWC2_56_8]HAO93132.1 hypothetical protein [Deltaproteobacteria bacterium]
MRKHGIYLVCTLIAGFLAYTVLNNYASINPLQWALLVVILVISHGLYSLLGRGAFKTDARKHLAIALVYGAAAASVFYPTANSIFRGDDWLILMLFNSIDGFSLKTLKDISFFEMFGHIRFQPLAHLLIFVRYLAFGNNILLYHILNIALHVSAAFLVFLVLKAFLKDTQFPFIFGLLFITLPSQFDTVAWTYHIYIILGTMLALSTIFLIYRYVETERTPYMLLAVLFALISVLLYEPAFLAPASVLFIAVGLYAGRGKALPRRNLAIIAVLVLATYAFYLGITAWGFSVTSPRHKMSLGIMATTTMALNALKVMAVNVWESFFVKNIGVSPYVQIKDIVYVKLPELFYADAAAIVKLSLALFLTSLSRIARTHRYVFFTLLAVAISYIFIISIGRLVTNELAYVPTQSRYQYFPNAMLVIAAAMLLWPKYQAGRWRAVITTILFAFFFWNSQNSLYANNQVAGAMEPLDGHYQKVKGFLSTNLGARLFIDFTPDTKGSFEMGSDMALDYLFKGRVTKFLGAATHVYDGSVFTENAAYFGAADKYLNDFTVKWFLVRDKNRDIKSDISIIGSESVYPRISIAPGNAVKLEIKDASTGATGVFLLHYPAPPENITRTWIGAEISVQKKDDEVTLSFNGMPYDKVTLQSTYIGWSMDGIDLLGGYYRGAAESIYVNNLHFHADTAESDLDL